MWSNIKALNYLSSLFAGNRLSCFTLGVVHICLPKSRSLSFSKHKIKFPKETTG